MKQNQPSDTGYKSYLVTIKGRVQGVGFRPFVHRLAKALELTGTVFNRPDGVFVHIEGNSIKCDDFIDELKQKAPPASRIKEVSRHETELNHFTDFRIIPSQNSDRIITEISPDIAICNDCIQELYSNNRRNTYPFNNCTNCGPRFTLIDDYPYDRINTTMNEFEMCDACKPEFDDPLNRRFHAQPISCPNCGPTYEYYIDNRKISDFNEIIKLAAERIEKGMLVAIKGLGGYNITCDATNENAVDHLRNFKIREKKPFAVMFRSLEIIRKICSVTPEEEGILTSWRKPIVVLEQKNEGILAKNISAGLNSIGAFLPYLPLHFLLFDHLDTDAIVLTSGNESDIPIICTEENAQKAFIDISGGLLSNNRKIARRADDSVVRVIDSNPRIMRRARGYAPEPVDLDFHVNGILATGAELSNCFCIGKENQVILSQHIGDLKNMETFEFFRENISEFGRLYRFEPIKVACDLHPDYLSSQYAHELNLPLVEVQHHHAHIVAVMAEYGINDSVIGISYDGVGYGTDGNIWGSEVMIADYASFERISHFEYIPLPGGDLATKQPWRTAISYLYHSFGKEYTKLKIPLLNSIDIKKAAKLVEAMDHKINSPLCCSTGRLFDAVAALTGICIKSNYHAEAPLRLENHLISGVDETFSFSGSKVISVKDLIHELVEDIQSKKSMDYIVTKFHNTVASIAMYQVKLANEQSNIQQVVLSGGSFQNKYLTEKLVTLLLQNKFEVYYPQEVPCNDGGLALGQLAIAAKKGD